MKQAVFFYLILLNSTVLSAQFTEPQEIPNGSTLTNYANVIAVNVTAQEDGWIFSVTLESPDQGCEQYADWWEVLDEKGNLLYRRILTHSHVNEQPFTRSSMKEVLVSENQMVWIRGHMNNNGYGGHVLKGSPKSGFKKAVLSFTLGADLEKSEPLPTGCRF